MHSVFFAFASCQKESIFTNPVNQPTTNKTVSNSVENTKVKNCQLGFLDDKTLIKVKQLTGDKGVNSLQEFDKLMQANIAPFSYLNEKQVSILRKSLVFDGDILRGYNYGIMLSTGISVEELINFHVILNGINLFFENFHELPFDKYKLKTIERYQNRNANRGCPDYPCVNDSRPSRTSGPWHCIERIDDCCIMPPL